MLSGRIILIVADSNEAGNVFIYSSHEYNRHLNTILTHFAINLILWCKMTDRRTRQSQRFLDTSQTKQKYSTDGEIRVHVCAWYAHFQSCCRWWTRWWRYYSNGCCSRIVAICNCVGGPERFSTYKTLVTINGGYELIQG